MPVNRSSVVTPLRAAVTAAAAGAVGVVIINMFGTEPELTTPHAIIATELSQPSSSVVPLLDNRVAQTSTAVHGTDPTDPTAFRLQQMCGNTFFANEDATPKPVDRLILSLPASDVRTLREASLRELDKRCNSAFPLNQRPDMKQLGNALRNAANGMATPPAQAIKQMIDRGDLKSAQQRLLDTIAARDPVDWAELAIEPPEFSVETDIETQSEMQNETQNETQRRRFAALGLVACDRSVECGPSSLQALQLCAFQASCVGTVDERILPLLGYSKEMLTADADEIRMRLSSLPSHPSRLVKFLLHDDSHK